MVTKSKQMNIDAGFFRYSEVWCSTTPPQQLPTSTAKYCTFIFHDVVNNLSHSVAILMQSVIHFCARKQILCQCLAFPNQEAIYIENKTNTNPPTSHQDRTKQTREEMTLEKSKFTVTGEKAQKRFVEGKITNTCLWNLHISSNVGI